MKPLLVQTLAWIAAVLTALLLALNVPESQLGPSSYDTFLPSGGISPR